MNRSTYFDLCSRRLSLLCFEVEVRGKLNVLNYHLHCEDFYIGLFNNLFNYSLKNTNETSRNAAGIDLLDSTQKIVLQVSSTATKDKIESALIKDLSSYSDHTFKFISIAKDATALRGKTYINPHRLTFDTTADIHDLKSLLAKIQHLEITKQKEIYKFLKEELHDDLSEPLSETNIAEVINILAKENLNNPSETLEIKSFNIDDKISFNRLDLANDIIEDYKIYHSQVSHIYSQFDQLGNNVSLSVLSSFRTSYIKLRNSYDSDDLFFKIIEDAMKTVSESANFNQLPLEVLELCVSILAVDAFIRCKIFKIPR